MECALGLLAPPGVPRAREVGGAPGDELHGRVRDRLEEPAVVRDQHDGGVDRGQLALEPFEALDVQVVRRLVQEHEIGVAAERARQRGARQLSAGERVQAAVEILVREAEAAHDRGRVVAPGIAARVLEPGLRLGVAGHRCRVMDSARHRRLERLQLLLERDQVGRAREHVLAEREPAVERRALVVQRDPRALVEDDLPGVRADLPGDQAQQRRLARAVRPGKRQPVSPLDLERDLVEEHGAAELLRQIRDREYRHPTRMTVAARPWSCLAAPPAMSSHVTAEPDIIPPSRIGHSSRMPPPCDGSSLRLRPRPFGAATGS